MESTFVMPPEIVRIVLTAFVCVAFVFVNAIIMGYAERKLAGHFQRRLGPMEVGPHGILQMIIDGVKLIGKQLLIPIEADRFLFRIAPIMAFMPAVLPFLVIPFSRALQVRDLNLGLIYIVAFSTINVMAILVAGWGSNNKYSLFGAMRSVAQNIAFEIPILLCILAIALRVNTLSMQEIVARQNFLDYVLSIPIFIIYFVAALAETNRAPFDLPEAESELTAGFHTEYSGMGFSIFFLAEYANMFVVCSIATVLFLGGWKGIPLPLGEYSGAVWFLVKVYGLLFIMIWVRWTYPRVRFDQLMNLCWKYLIPFSLVYLLMTALFLKLQTW